MAEFVSPVTLELDRKGIPFRIFTHPGVVHSLEQAAAERGQRPSQVVRSILFRLNEEEFVMVLVAGPQQISWPLLREYLGISRISMASPDEVLAQTGYKTGSVSPFGLPGPTRVLLDESVFAEDEISIGSGARNTTVIMRKDDLIRALGLIERVRLSQA